MPAHRLRRAPKYHRGGRGTPGASRRVASRIVLFGSRARGEGQPDSGADRATRLIASAAGMLATTRSRATCAAVPDPRSGDRAAHDAEARDPRRQAVQAVQAVQADHGRDRQSGERRWPRLTNRAATATATTARTTSTPAATTQPAKVSRTTRVQIPDDDARAAERARVACSRGRARPPRHSSGGGSHTDRGNRPRPSGPTRHRRRRAAAQAARTRQDRHGPASLRDHRVRDAASDEPAARAPQHRRANGDGEQHQISSTPAG